MGVAKTCKSSDQKAVECHQIDRPYPEGDPQGKGQKTHGDVVGHDHAGRQGFDGKDRIKPYLTLFHFLNEMGRHHERDEGLVRLADNEAIRKSQKEDAEGGQEPGETFSKSPGERVSKEPGQVMPSGRGLPVDLAIGAADKLTEVDLEIALRGTLLSKCLKPCEIGCGLPVEVSDVLQIGTAQTSGPTLFQGFQKRFQTLPTRFAGSDEYLDGLGHGRRIPNGGPSGNRK